MWCPEYIDVVDHYFLMKFRMSPRCSKFGVSFCGCSLAAVVSKIGIDQSIMAPLGTVAFFAAMKTMELKPSESLETIKVRYIAKACF